MKIKPRLFQHMEQAGLGFYWVVFSNVHIQPGTMRMSPWEVASVPYSSDVMIVARAIENRERTGRTAGNQRRMGSCFLSLLLLTILYTTDVSQRFYSTDG